LAHYSVHHKSYRIRLLWFNENGHLDKGDKIDGGGVRR
jgi:hypothetical protein